MSYDPRKKALELAKKRAKHRQRMKKKKEEKVNRKSSKDNYSNKNRQQIYLEKLREREREKKQAERDKLQKEMDKLKNQQKLEKKREIIKKKDEEIRKKLKLEKIQTEKIEKKKFLEEKEKRKEKIEQEKKDNEIRTKRLKQEKMLLNNLENKNISKKQNSLKTPISKNKSKKEFLTTDSATNNIIHREISTISKEIINMDLSPINKLKSNRIDYSIKKISVQLQYTQNFHERKKREELILSKNPEKYQFKNTRSNFEKRENLINIWKNLQTYEYVHPKFKPKIIISNKNKKFKAKLQEEEHFWLPQIQYDILLKIVIALSSKKILFNPSKLKILVDASLKIIVHGLIDGINLELIEPVFLEDDLKSIDRQFYVNKKDKLKDLKKSWRKFLSENSKEIMGFRISEKFSKFSTTKEIDNNIMRNFLRNNLIKDFLHGIKTQGNDYPIKSMIFENSIINIFPKLNKKDLETNLKMIVDYAIHFGFIKISNSKKFRSGKSKFLKLTAFGWQKLSRMGKNKKNSQNNIKKKYITEKYIPDYNCPSCNYGLLTNFEICPKCGYNLKLKCKNCNFSISKQWNQCPYCGIKNLQKISANR